MAQRLDELKFLIIDDYGDMRGVLRNMLQTFGIVEIGLAANGSTAIKKMEEQRYDVVLCDYNLGDGRDGQQVLEEIRKRKLIGVSAIFIMITAENTRMMVMGAVEYEPDSYLTKPFTKDLLGQRLERLLNKKADLKDIEYSLEHHDYDKALMLLEKKISDNPPNINEFLRLKADICLRIASYDQAEVIYQGVLATREIAWARLGLGKAYYGSKRYSDARTVFAGLIESNERFMAAYDWLSKTQQMLDDAFAAQKTLEKAAKLSAKAIIRQRNLGELALRNKDEKTAEKAFNLAVRLGKHSVYKHPSLYANLAKSKAATKNGEFGLKVIRDLKKEFRGDPEADLYAAMTLSILNENIGNSDEAKRNLAQAHKLYSAQENTVTAELSLDMAKACANMGEMDRAKELVQQAVKNNHAEELFLKDVSSTLSDIGLVENPGMYIGNIKREVIKLNNRGVEMAKAGHLEEAVELFKEAANGMTSNKIVNLNAARILMLYMQTTQVSAPMLGQVREYLERVRRLDPENRTLHQMQEMFKQIVRA